MLKRISKFWMMTIMCMLLLAGTVSAAEARFSFKLYNTGTDIKFYQASNKKVIMSDPWTLKVEEITCRGLYGIRFAPVIYNDGSSIRVCSQSSVWRKTTGYGTVAYASGDAQNATYRIGARQDDSYDDLPTFATKGWWNADRLSDR